MKFSKVSHKWRKDLLQGMPFVSQGPSLGDAARVIIMCHLKNVLFIKQNMEINSLSQTWALGLVSPEARSVGECLAAAVAGEHEALYVRLNVLHHA